MFLKPGAKKSNKNNLVAPTGFEPVFQPRPRGVPGYVPFVPAELGRMTWSGFGRRNGGAWP